MDEQSEAQKSRIAKLLSKKIGRPSDSHRENLLRSAATEVLAGSKPADVTRKFGVVQTEVDRFLKQTFPNDTDRFQFLEDCMITNATLASGIFQQKHGEMTAMEAAKATVMFTGKALEVKKAREAGFKETPMNVGVILNLEKAISNALKH